MTRFPLTGGCSCEALRFEVTEPVVVASYCHCKRWEPVPDDGLPRYPESRHTPP